MTQRMLTISDTSWEGYLYRQEQDKKTLRRINDQEPPCKKTLQ